MSADTKAPVADPATDLSSISELSDADKALAQMGYKPVSCQKSSPSYLPVYITTPAGSRRRKKYKNIKKEEGNNLGYKVKQGRAGPALTVIQ